MDNTGDTNAVLRQYSEAEVHIRHCKAPKCSNIVEGVPSKRYCSKECKNRARRRASFETRICPICSSGFSPESGRQKWCSDTCRDEHKTRLKRMRYNEILFIVKELEQKFRSLASREEQHLYCTKLLEEAKKNHKIRQALTAPGFSNFYHPPSQKDRALASLYRRAPKKFKSKTSTVFMHLSWDEEEKDLVVTVCDGYIPNPTSYTTFLGVYTHKNAEIMKLRYEEILRFDDCRTSLLIDHGYCEPDLEKALDMERLIQISDNLHVFLKMHTKYFHGMLPHEYLRKKPRPSLNLISDFTDYID